MYAFPPMRSALSIVGAIRLVTYLGAFGAPSEKPLELMTTLLAMMLPRTQRQAHDRLRGAPVPLVTVSATGLVEGDAELQASQAYPAEFAVALALLVRVSAGMALEFPRRTCAFIRPRDASVCVSPA